MSVRSLINEVTADDFAPPSGATLAQLSKLSHTSTNNCLQIENLLLKRIKDKSLSVKIKALQTIKYLLSNGSASLTRAFRSRQLSLIIKQNIPMSEAAGNIIQLKAEQSSRLTEVRKLASEVLTILIEHQPPPASTTTPTVTSAGIGSTRAPSPKQDVSFMDKARDKARNLINTFGDRTEKAPPSRIGKLESVNYNRNQDESNTETSSSRTFEDFDDTPRVTVQEQDVEEEVNHERKAIERLIDTIASNASMMRFIPSSQEFSKFLKKSFVFDSFAVVSQIEHYVHDSNIIWFKRAFVFGLLEMLTNNSDYYPLVAEILEDSSKRDQFERLGKEIKQIKTNVARFLAIVSPVIQTSSAQNDLFGGLTVEDSGQKEDGGFFFETGNEQEEVDSETPVSDQKQSNLIDDFDLLSCSDSSNQKQSNSFSFVDDFMSLM
ncbi:hypothetical protein P9112_005431 [Eukaryota sp. TZLM1-RC]